MSLDVVNLSTSLKLCTHCTNGNMACLHCVGDLPVRPVRCRLQYLRDQLAPLFGGEMTAVQVNGQDEGERIAIIRDNDGHRNV